MWSQAANAPWVDGVDSTYLGYNLTLATGETGYPLIGTAYADSVGTGATGTCDIARAVVIFGNIAGGNWSGDGVDITMGTISGGTFTGDGLTNDGGGISGGTFTGDGLINNCNISGGTFTGSGFLNNAYVGGGTFSGAGFTNAGSIGQGINGGTFTGSGFTNNGYIGAGMFLGTYINWPGAAINFGRADTSRATIINVPVSSGKIWTNASSTDQGNWNNPDNWIGGVPGTDDNIIFGSSITLTQDIPSTNHVYVGRNGITIDGDNNGSGGHYTIHGDITGANGADEVYDWNNRYPVSPATNGIGITLSNITVTGNVTAGNGGGSAGGWNGGMGGSITLSNATTGNVTAGNGGGGSTNYNQTSGGNGGSITISGTNLDLSGLAVSSGNGGDDTCGGQCGGIGIPGSVTLTYSGITTNSSTFVYNASDFIVNGIHYGAWNKVFNPQVFYFSDQQGNGARTGDWGDSRNWWFNASFTTPAEAVPAGYNDVIINSGHITQNTLGSAAANTITLNGSSTIAISITTTSGATFSGTSANTTTSPTAQTPQIIHITITGSYDEMSAANDGTVYLPDGSSFSYNDVYNAYGSWPDANTGAAYFADYLMATYYGNSSIDSAVANANVITISIPYGSPLLVGDWNVGLVEIPGTSGHGWSSITSSADGTKLAAVDYGGSIWTNSGTNGAWVEAPGTSGHNWASITSSADGSKLAAVDLGGSIWTTSNMLSISKVQDALPSSNGVGSITSNGPLTFNGGSSNNSPIITQATTTFNGNEASSTGDISAIPINQWYAVPNTSGHSWYSITSSADGTKLAAVEWAGGSIWTNSGTNGAWVEAPDTSGHSWWSITSSADGTKLAAVDYNGSIWINSGTNGAWVVVPGTSGHSWWSITSSADGSKLAAVAGGSIWTNSDENAAWQAVPGTSGHHWYSITSSADGTKLAAVDYNGSIWTNSGTNGAWVEAPDTSGHSWYSITSSADGTKLAAAERNGSIWINSGTNGAWVAVPGTSGHNWTSITSSADGTKLAAAEWNGSIWINSGTNGAWVEAPDTSGHSWWSITSSADGTKLAAVDYNGFIWQYTNVPNTSGPVTRIFTSPVTTVRNFLTEAGHSNWIVVAQGAAVDISHAVYSTATNLFKALIDPITKLAGSFFWGDNSGGQVVPQITVGTTTLAYTGDASTKTLKWNPHVNWDTASTCIYSYNSDFSNPITTTCSGDDTSLARPTAGDHTLYLRGTDSHGDVSETSLRFFYDNTSPVWTSCGNDLLDEATRPYYYLASDVAGTCTATVDTELRGATTTATSTVTGHTVSGNIDAQGHDITLKNIHITGSVTSNGASTGANGGAITVATSTTGTISANGASGSGTTKGGNGGVITIWNSDAILAGTNVTANGGSLSSGCANGGDAGDININNSDGYTATSNPGRGSNATCPNTNHAGGQTRTPVVIVRPTPPTPTPSTPTTPTITPTSNSGSSRASGGTSTLAPIFTVLPAVNKLSPIKLSPVPTFGDTTSKKAFSLGEGITSFLFAPLPTTLTQTLGTNLTQYLKQAGFSKEQDLITISKKPLLLPKPTAAIAGLFTVSAKGLPIKLPNQEFSTNTTVPVSVYLTSDTKAKMLEKITITPNTDITIALKGGKTADFNGKTLSFTSNTLTLKTPSQPGTYTLTSPASPLGLLIEVTGGKATPEAADDAPQASQSPSWFSKLINYFF